MNTENKIETREVEKVREYYKTVKGLFGLIGKEVVVKTDSLSREVFFSIPFLRGVDKVWINGDVWIKKEMEGDGSVRCCDNGDFDEKHDCLKNN